MTGKTGVVAPNYRHFTETNTVAFIGYRQLYSAGRGTRYSYLTYNLYNDRVKDDVEKRGKLFT